MKNLLLQENQTFMKILFYKILEPYSSYMLNKNTYGAKKQGQSEAAVIWL